VINRPLRNNRWLVAVVTCATLAPGASFAEERGGKSDEAAPSGPSDSRGAANKASTGGQNSGLAGNRSDGGGATLRAPTTDGRAVRGRAAGEGGSGSRGTASGTKATAAPGSIDLIRPDDGYSSLRRRAARSSPIAAGQKKSPPIVSTVTVVPHPRSLVPALGEPVRNSTGVTIARTTSGPAKTDSIHTVPGVPGGIGISKTHITAMAPVNGIMERTWVMQAPAGLADQKRTYLG
jgi:hypothetical protein